MKAQGVSRDTAPWRSAFQPFTAWYGFIGASTITLVTGFHVFLKGNWSASGFVAAYIGIPIFIVPIIGWKLWHRTKVRSHRRYNITRQNPTDALFFSLCLLLRWTSGPAVFKKEKLRSLQLQIPIARRGNVVWIVLFEVVHPEYFWSD